jgi:hypothetical protein
VLFRELVEDTNYTLRECDAQEINSANKVQIHLFGLALKGEKNKYYYVALPENIVVGVS